MIGRTNLKSGGITIKNGIDIYYPVPQNINISKGYFCKETDYSVLKCATATGKNNISSTKTQTVVLENILLCAAGTGNAGNLFYYTINEDGSLSTRTDLADVNTSISIEYPKLIKINETNAICIYRYNPNSATKKLRYVVITKEGNTLTRSSERDFPISNIYNYYNLVNIENGYIYFIGRYENSTSQYPTCLLKLNGTSLSVVGSIVLTSGNYWNIAPYNSTTLIAYKTTSSNIYLYKIVIDYDSYSMIFSDTPDVITNNFNNQLNDVLKYDDKLLFIYRNSTNDNIINIVQYGNTLSSLSETIIGNNLSKPAFLIDNNLKCYYMTTDSNPDICRKDIKIDVNPIISNEIKVYKHTSSTMFNGIDSVVFKVDDINLYVNRVATNIYYLADDKRMGATISVTNGNLIGLSTTNGKSNDIITCKTL